MVLLPLSGLKTIWKIASIAVQMDLARGSLPRSRFRGLVGGNTSPLKTTAWEAILGGVATTIRSVYTEG